MISSKKSENVGSTGFPENQAEGQDQQEQNGMLALVNDDAGLAGKHNIGIMRSTRSPFGQLINVGFVRSSRYFHDFRYGIMQSYICDFSVLEAKNIGFMWPNQDNILEK
jgi:hypothetical protein